MYAQSFTQSINYLEDYKGGWELIALGEGEKHTKYFEESVVLKGVGGRGGGGNLGWG